ncbi:MAG TPA: hypothetical protein VLW52_07790 [Opitutaceae bacterium]|nr:hypothetical protein [Opitutaceae bacterium]
MMRGPMLLAAVLLGTVAVALGAGRVEGELAQAPTPQRIAALQAEAEQAGWGSVAHDLRGAALSLYEKQGAQTQAWYYLYRWASLFSVTEDQAIAGWIESIKRSGADPAKWGAGFRPSGHPLVDFWPADLRTFALASPEFSDQFFTLISPLDQPAMVMSILAALWTRQPADFKDYANLALAIAVVYDVPPPPSWPHGQVSTQALPRQLPPPEAVFAFFVKADRAGITLQHLRALPAAELKFVVDTTASYDELVWAQKNVQTPLSQLARVYDVVRYRRDRLDNGVLLWPQPSYRLMDILQAGGICVDQAYFAATVGKAKGVPTLLFRGAGLDGRHAWFGFLDDNGHWQLDCGRYADQKLVAGVAYDPQTWTDISDHELTFLTEGFRRLPLYKTSRMHSQFAAVYYDAGEFAAAARAARTAVNIERRNLDGWNILIRAQQHLGENSKQLEAIYQEGARAFQRYPDIETEFKALLSRSLRARGEVSAADFAERSDARKYDQADRADLGVRQASDILKRSLDSDDMNTRIRTFYSVLNTYGRGAGVDFFDRVVRPFVEHMLRNDQPREAMQAVTQARRVLRVEPNSQLEGDLNALADQAQKALN